MPTIAPSAVVSPRARLGAGVRIGAFSVVHDEVELGDGTEVAEHCVIGSPVADQPPLRVGAGSLIRSHSVLYQGASIGPKFETGHHALVRAGARIGVNFRLGSFATVEGELEIGDYVRAHGYTAFGVGSVVEDFAWIFPRCLLTNDPLPPSDLRLGVRIGAGAVVCAGVTLMPGCSVGRGAFVAAAARVEGEVPDATVLTADGRYGGPVTRLMNLGSGLRHPWLSHYTEKYPSEAQPRLAELRGEVLAAARAAPRRTLV